MAVARKRPKMRRTQVCLLPEEYEMARRMAESRRVTISRVVRDAIRSAAAQDDEVERRRLESMWSIVGILEGADPDLSVKVDDILYGPDMSTHE